MEVANNNDMGSIIISHIKPPYLGRRQCAERGVRAMPLERRKQKIRVALVVGRPE
jgi:hypothetical protein